MALISPDEIPTAVIRERMRDAVKSCPTCGGQLAGFHQWPESEDPDRFAEFVFYCGARVEVPQDGTNYAVTGGCMTTLDAVLWKKWDEILTDVEGEIPEPPEAA